MRRANSSGGWRSRTGKQRGQAPSGSSPSRRQPGCRAWKWARRVAKLRRRASLTCARSREASIRRESPDIRQRDAWGLNSSERGSTRPRPCRPLRRSQTSLRAARRRSKARRESVARPPSPGWLWRSSLARVCWVRAAGGSAWRTLRRSGVFHHQGPAVRQGQRLDQAEDGRLSPGAQGAAGMVAQQGVGAVLDEAHPVGAAEGRQLGHRLRQAEVVGQQQGPRPGASPHQVRDVVEVAGQVAPHPPESGAQAGPEVRLDLGAAVVGGQQHLGPLGQAQGREGGEQGVAAAEVEAQARLGEGKGLGWPGEAGSEGNSRGGSNLMSIGARF